MVLGGAAMTVSHRVFVSCNGDSTMAGDERRIGIKHEVVERLSREGYEPQLFLQAGIPLHKGWSFSGVVEVMRACVGAVVLGFPRWQFGKKPGVVAEFVNFEGGVASALGLPMFIAVEPGLSDRGITYTGGGLKIVEMPTTATRETIFSGIFAATFDGWLRELATRQDIFLGYCSNASGFAAQVELILNRSGARVHNWAMDYRAGSSILEEIETARKRCDRAILIFSEDDPLEGHEGQAAPRDNVVFEAGYFVSARGPRNTLIIRVGNAKMPADLGGTIYLAVPSLAEGPARIEAQLRDFAVQGLSGKLL
jgi:hypothetical protein